MSSILLNCIRVVKSKIETQEQTNDGKSTDHSPKNNFISLIQGRFFVERWVQKDE